MNKRLLIFVLLAPLLGLIFAGGRFYYALKFSRYQGPEVVFEIRPGETFGQINSHLAKQKLISNTRVFHRYCQYLGVLEKFRVGKYLLTGSFNIPELVQALLYGKSLGINVTIPEGKNLYEIANILDEKRITDRREFIVKAKDREFAESLGIPGSTVEGYLFPETYSFAGPMSAAEVIKMMVELFFLKTKDLPWNISTLSPHELITLASVVEKETGAKIERPRIAGVFFNRLKKKMKLQSDPTTIYGIYENYRGNLKRSDLLTPTLYNTYTIPALPIGPISNPGLAALNAVLNPEEHDYLFFVSQNDGLHTFSKDYGNHQKAVQNYQVNRRNREGKSWRNLKQ